MTGDEFRRAALSFPEAEERATWGQEAVELLDEAWRMTAPKRVVATHDAA